MTLETSELRRHDLTEKIPNFQQTKPPTFLPVYLHKRTPLRSYPRDLTFKTSDNSDEETGLDQTKSTYIHTYPLGRVENSKNEI